MPKSALLAAAMLAFAPTSVMAQADTSLDTITIVESSQIMYDGQLVDYFLLHTNDNELRFIEDTAYIKIIGFISGPDTSNLPDAVVWMKTANPMIGDGWPGMVPADDILPTNEQIVAINQVTVGAGTFTAYEVSVYDLQGTYLGKKWWSDGAGLLGWDLGKCNETQNLELIGYTVAAGSDFWPHTVGDEYIIQSTSEYTTVDAPVKTITVNGSSSDWGGVAPVVQDPSGDDSTGFNGCDIRNLYVAADDTYLYLMISFWDGAPDTAWGILATPAYAFVLDEYGGQMFGFTIAYEPAPTSSWSISGLNLDATGADVACGSVIEARIPLVNLGYYGMELPGYFFAVNNGDYDVSCYNTVRLPAYCPIQVPGDANHDFEVKTSDVIYLVNYVLKAGPEPLPCPAAGDANGDGEVKTSDIIYLVNYVLKAGPYPVDICPLIPGVWSCP